MEHAAAKIAGPGLSLWDAKSLSILGEDDEIAFAAALDDIGRLSSKAQGLLSPITSVNKLRASDGHKIYLMCDHEAKRVLGFLKVGRKHLFLFEGPAGKKMVEADPLCVLDFHVHKSIQRQGIGFKIFKGVLERERVRPWELAYDRPSTMLRPFLARHFGLHRGIDQPNRFMVFEEYFFSVSSANGALGG